MLQMTYIGGLASNTCETVTIRVMAAHRLILTCMQTKSSCCASNTKLQLTTPGRDYRLKQQICMPALCSDCRTVRKIYAPMTVVHIQGKLRMLQNTNQLSCC